MKKIKADIDQEIRIKDRLARMQPRQSMASMARGLGLPAGTVAGNVYGHRCNPETQARIAEFLGCTMAELFGGNGASHVVAESTAAEAPEAIR